MTALIAATPREKILAARSIPSLIAVKQTMVAPYRDGIAAATDLENAQFQELLGGAANAAALAEFTGKG